MLESSTYEDGLRLTDLATFAGMTPQSMSELVDDLEHRGYVERRSDPTDRRAKRIHLTEEGHANIRAGMAPARESDRHVSELIGKQRYDELRAILQQIIASDEARGQS